MGYVLFLILVFLPPVCLVTFTALTIAFWKKMKTGRIVFLILAILSLILVIIEVIIYIFLSIAVQNM